jgi:hypothetical protein
MTDALLFLPGEPDDEAEIAVLLEVHLNHVSQREKFLARAER